MSLYTNTKPYSYIYGDKGPEFLKVGTTFKFLGYDSIGAVLETIDEDKKSNWMTVNTEVFKTAFKEVDL